MIDHSSSRLSAILQRFALLPILLLAALTLPAAAQDGRPSLDLPVDCRIGVVCFPVAYYDHDPASPAVLDYTGGHLASDKHRGTDIRVHDVIVMEAGVPVIAAAPGVVKRVRDGVEDINIRKIDRETVKNRKAGNAVVIGHGEDWETQYSHLKQGSIVVRPGQQVEAGDVIGMIGMSGWTEFPHLHFSIRYKGEHFDPFSGRAGDKQVVEGGVWSDSARAALKYIPAAVMSAGFAGVKPGMIEARDGLYEGQVITDDAPVLTFWVDYFGQKAGDVFEMRIIGPDGRPVVQTKKPLEKDRVLNFIFVGRKIRDGAWPTGEYRGEFRLLRSEDGASTEVASAVRTIEVR